jgi:hypothetical protein
MRIVKVLLRLILGVLLVVIGIGVAGWLFYQVTNTSVEWPTAKGVILSSGLSYEREPPISHLFSSQDWLVTVSFEYEVQGVRYSWYQQWYETKAEAEKKQLQYSPGATITIYYNPNSPTIAVIEPEKKLVSMPDLLYVLFIIPVLGAGVALIILASQDLVKDIRSRLGNRAKWT